MTTQKTTIVLAGAAILMLVPAAAHAQVDDRAAVNALRECRQIAEAAARTACYDGIPLSEPALAAAPAATPSPSPRPTGFGSNQLPQPSPAERGAPDRIATRVAAATERTPGVLLLTLEDGAQWQFVDAAPGSYDPPHRGSSVEIVGASLGSYLMRYVGQSSIRIRRVR